MDVLKEIAGVIERNRLQMGKVVAPNSFNGASTKIQKSGIQLYQALIDDQIITDEDAANFIGMEKGDVKYRKVKSALKKQMLSALLTQNFTESSLNQRQKAYFDCYKNWSAAKILLGKGARSSAISLFRSVLKLAIRFEFTDLILDVTKTLRLHFGTIERNVREYRKYDELFQTYYQIFEWEQMAESFYCELSITNFSREKKREAAHKKAKSYLEKLQGILDHTDAYRVLLCAMLVELMVYSSIHDYKSMIKVSEAYIKRFKKKNYKANLPLQIAYYHLMVSCTQLCLYNEGKKVAKECLELVDTGSFNWFKYQELLFMLSMHTGHYREALDIYEAVRENNRLAFQNAMVRETWQVFEAYLFFLIKTGEIESLDDHHWSKKFRLQKFLNNTPVYAKDKRGKNIPILIIQIMFLILQGQYYTVIDKVDAINQYCVRYLKQDDTFRSNCFIKMLVQIPASGFHKAAVVRKANRYKELLLQKPIDQANESHEVEIIPYEILWGIILNKLPNQIYSPPKRKLPN